MSQNSSVKDDQASGNKKTISLPISRVRLIMKSSPDVSSINQDALFLTTKATVSYSPPSAHSSAAANAVSTVNLSGTCELKQRVCVSCCRCFRSCLCSIWLSRLSTTAPGRTPTACLTATWRTPRRRRRLSTSSQVRSRHLQAPQLLWCLRNISIRGRAGHRLIGMLPQSRPKGARHWTSSCSRCVSWCVNVR